MQENVKPPVRGMCCDYSLAMSRAFPELRVAKGWYIDLFCVPHQHWWCVTPDGIIVDPTVAQFLMGGTYKEYTGEEPTSRCLNCGALIFDMGNFCDQECNNHFMATLKR